MREKYFRILLKLNEVLQSLCAENTVNTDGDCNNFVFSKLTKMLRPACRMFCSKRCRPDALHKIFSETIRYSFKGTK